MIDYYDQLTQEAKDEVREAVQLLLKQTFVLERKYNKSTARMQVNQDFRCCSKHLAFLREYFMISGINVSEDSQEGIIYLQGEQVIGDKVSRLTTLYVLILKLIYDEQMSSVSSGSHVITTLSEMHEKLSSFRLLHKNPALTEVRKSISLLKRYQVIEPLDVLDDMEGKSRILVYPSIHVVLAGEQVKALLDHFKEVEEEDGEEEI